MGYRHRAARSSEASSQHREVSEKTKRYDENIARFLIAIY